MRKDFFRFLEVKRIAYSNILRTFWYKQIFGSFGRSTLVNGRIRVYSVQNISIGNNSSINEGCQLNARSELRIGNYVHLSPGVLVNTGGLQYLEFGEKRKHLTKPIIINDGAWIGAGAIINPGVIIGKNSVIGAGAVVTKDIPDNVVAVGVPAQVIKKIQ